MIDNREIKVTQRIIIHGQYRNRIAREQMIQMEERQHNCGQIVYKLRTETKIAIELKTDRWKMTKKRCKQMKN